MLRIVKSLSSMEWRGAEKPSGKEGVSDPAAAVTHRGISHGNDSKQTAEKALPMPWLAQRLKKSKDKHFHEGSRATATAACAVSIRPALSSEPTGFSPSVNHRWYRRDSHPHRGGEGSVLRSSRACVREAQALPECHGNATVGCDAHVGEL